MKSKAHSGPQGPSQRQLRVAETIRRALSEVFARGDIHDPELSGASITVGEVRTSPDLKQALVFVMPLGGKDQDVVLTALNRNAAEIRREANARLALKFSPKLKFRLDVSFDQMDETRRILSDPRVRRDIGSGD